MNTFPINSWSGESEDRELQKLIHTMEKLAAVVHLSYYEYHIIVLVHLSPNSQQLFFVQRSKTFRFKTLDSANMWLFKFNIFNYSNNYTVTIIAATWFSYIWLNIQPKYFSFNIKTKDELRGQSAIKNTDQCKSVIHSDKCGVSDSADR